MITLALDGYEITAGVLEMIILNLCTADDISLLADSEHDLQLSLNRVHQASSRFQTTISISKTMSSMLEKDSHQMNVKLCGSVLIQAKVDFVYLRGTISAESSCDKEVSGRSD